MLVLIKRRPDRFGMRKSLPVVCFFSLFFLVFLCGPVHSAKNERIGHHGHKHKSARSPRHRGDIAGERADKTGGLKIKSLRSGPERAWKEAPAEEVASARDENDEYLEYKVKRGDTVDKLATRFNVGRDEIVDLNKFSKKRLRPGATVFIPKTGDEGEEGPVTLAERPFKAWKSEEERGILVKVAKSFAGAPYRYGGESVRGLDCSAFVRKMYSIFEVDLPRSAREQFCAGQKVSRGDLAAGDLVFFKTRRLARYPTHVGIYIGDDKFIHASSLLRRGVKVDELSEAYFTRTYMGAVRVKAPPRSAADAPEGDQEQHKLSNTAG